ncbi:hypothetical protein F5884DRAFT_819480 [Xylogone sp. PMI_703]|nr:hypothetical protein F5884DRAFT_819480 [Xylogone sp. PMI_703]
MNFFGCLALCSTLLGASAVAQTLLVANPSLACKVIPGDSGWPSLSLWQSLNSSLEGRLSTPSPIGLPCYPGPLMNIEQCEAAINVSLTEQGIANDPLLYEYPPITLTCPPVDPSLTQGKTCDLSSYPSYIVNTTKVPDVQAAVSFAARYNIRLVIKATGHSLSLGSLGSNSLEVWLHHLRTGISFEPSFKAVDGCTASGWTGAAIKYSGGYQWVDIYAVAQANNVIVVGGGDPTVSAVGGYVQGGGHSPAAQKFGLAASNVLEFQVVLASGKLVTATPCQNADLFWALRGGGGGTYGVVVSVTMKAYPESAVTGQILQIVPTSDEKIPSFVNAMEVLYAAYPALTDAGASGAASWKVQSFAPAVVGSSSTTGYQHVMMMFDNEVTYTDTFAPTLNKLNEFGQDINVTVTYFPFSTYFDFYNAIALSSPPSSPVGTGAVLASRLLDRHALSGNASGLASMLQTVIGQPGDFTEIDLEIVGGGQLAATASQLSASPGWESGIVHSIISRGFGVGTTASELDALRADMTYNRNLAQIALAPNTGAYINEGDYYDPDFIRTFWGTNADRLEAIKTKYDPQGVFYCPVCIGSGNTTTDGLGRVCTILN